MFFRCFPLSLSVSLIIASGKEVGLGIYKGKVLLVVNVASSCGFTESKYTQMTELYQKYREKVQAHKAMNKQLEVQRQMNLLLVDALPDREATGVGLF